jgi:ARG and Rhodanese-Phosphatase-superfamily-associated Protein domain
VKEIPFQLGDPLEYRRVAVYPLFPLHDPRAHYLTLEDALPRGLRVEEIDASGSVPQLRVVNPLAEDVLLYEGEELVGAKQNRILNVTVLVGAKSDLPIPVSCVEEGRWRSVGPVFAASPQAAHPRLRRRKAEALRNEPLLLGALPGRGLGRGARDEPPAQRRLADRRERRRLPAVGGPAREARGGVSAAAGAVGRGARARRRALSRLRLAP